MIHQLLKLNIVIKIQIETLWAVGGNNKKNSSSWILERWKS